MKLSIVDLGTVAPGSTETDALADSLAVARYADALGYHRIWFAEHHLSRSGASHHPELLIAAAIPQTRGIRLGSGAVLMNHYSPFKVAEMFAQLETMAPGRIDLGMGRATSGPVIDLALQQDRSRRQQPDHTQQVAEVMAWLHDAFPEDHPFAGHRLSPEGASVPEAWLLGSSSAGPGLAGGLGIGYVFAGFINPPLAASALRHYRQAFRPQGFGFESPQSILAVNVTVGDTTADGRRLADSAKGFYARLGRAGREAGKVTVPSPDEAAREMTVEQREEPTSIVDGRWPRFVAGGPDDVRATLEQMLAESEADELMIQNLIAYPDDRRRSHELLAEMFEVTPRAQVESARA